MLWSCIDSIGNIIYKPFENIFIRWNRKLIQIKNKASNCGHIIILQIDIDLIYSFRFVTIVII